MVDAAGLQDRAFANNRVGDLGVNQLAGGQIARTGVDGEFLVVEAEGGRGLLGQREVGFIERTDGADVFPVVVEHIALKLVAPRESLGNDLLAEILVPGMLVEQIKEGLTTEDVNAHRGQIGPFLG